MFLGEPLRPLCGLASGYPLHHLLPLVAGGSATIPLAIRTYGAMRCYSGAY